MGVRVVRPSRGTLAELVEALRGAAVRPFDGLRDLGRGIIAADAPRTDAQAFVGGGSACVAVLARAGKTHRSGEGVAPRTGSCQACVNGKRSPRRFPVRRIGLDTGDTASLAHRCIPRRR